MPSLQKFTFSVCMSYSCDRAVEKGSSASLRSIASLQRT
jgi:hypothetical protein